MVRFLLFNLIGIDQRRGVLLFEKFAQNLLHNADKSLVIENLHYKNGNENLILNVTSLLYM